MLANITLTIKDGMLAGKKYRFTDRRVCVVGRAEDCAVRLPNEREYRTVSRHHCVLDIDPPEVRVGDFGSCNGTYINGVPIGRHPNWRCPGALSLPLGDYQLKDGDELALGDAVFQVRIAGLPDDSACRADAPEEEELCACGA
ncbi:MAG TPA: FHA domain-containing protein [Gemmataceae bacterium]|jgi:pSer/pThr/pTyr-binding forkhead associated (FHA) protein|nr:FHA domain-containing protein [Gemmataceae bacterium]